MPPNRFLDPIGRERHQAAATGPEAAVREERGAIRHRWAGLGLVSIGIAMLGFGLWRNRAFIHDDAFITLRYARNLIEGHGLVWNIGERVEGYTSLAAVMLAAAVGIVGLDLVTAARLVNLLAALGMAGFLLAFCRHLERGPGTSAVAHALPVMLVLASRPLAAWILGGLEAPLFAAVVAVSAGNVLLLLQEPRSKSLALWAGLWLGLAVLVRPDGLVFGVVAAAFLLLRLGRPDRAGLAVFGRFAAAWLGLPCAHVLWRLSYYGAVVPNTLIAKATGLPGGVEGKGLMYLTKFLLSPPFLVLLVLVVPALLVRGRRLQVLFLLACIAGYAGLVVRVGGDHMPASRLFLPLVPLCALVVFFGLAQLLRGARWPVAAMVSLYAMAPWYRNVISNPCSPTRRRSWARSSADT